MIVKSNIKNYSVEIHDTIDFLYDLTRIEKSFFVIDSNVFNLYKKYFNNIEKNRLFVLDALEENKQIETALLICEKMVSFPEKRNLTLISIGGGITQDITGFAANILYRGIKWIFIPTTLLASCDSCIGGKTSLNYKKYKNLLGTFYPPNEIHISPIFFDSLTKSDFYSGLGEVYKFALMQKRTDYLLNDSAGLLNNDHALIFKYLQSSLEFKKGIIEDDEYDTGKRITLNFGHTFGHALESISNYKIPHGTGVAVGIIIANEISCNRGLVSTSKKKDIIDIILPIIESINVEFISPTDSFFESIKKDKKQSGNGFSVLLFDNNMDIRLFNDIQIDEIVTALSSVKELLQIRK